jgi:membrane protein insertase Oxa1/YidC/SpoIIIJ
MGLNGNYSKSLYLIIGKYEMEIEKQIKYPRAIRLLLLLFLLPAGIFLSEVFAMILVQFYKGPYGITIIIDAIITTTLMFPLIFILSYRPLLRHIAEQERVEKIMQVRLQLMQFAVAHTVDELLQTTLDEIEALTGSTVSFFRLSANCRDLGTYGGGCE